MCSGECDCLHWGDTEDSRDTEDNDKMMYDDDGGWLEECVQCDSDRECQGMWYQCLCQLHPAIKGETCKMDISTLFKRYVYDFLFCEYCKHSWT